MDPIDNYTAAGISAGGEGEAHYSQDNVIILHLLTASVAVAIVTTLTCCCICRRLRRNSDNTDEERQPLVSNNGGLDTESSPRSLPDSSHSSLMKSSAVPDIVALCIREIEIRGLDEEGLYRKSGLKSKADALREKFKDYTSPPDLTVEDIHVICSCLKGYLLNLPQCLLTAELRSDFINAAGISDSELLATEIRRNIDRMPLNYCEILSALIVHLQRVARSPGCRMSEDSLAIIFGPSVVGWLDHQHPSVKDSDDQKLVMKKLLAMPAEFWINIAAGTELTVST